MDIDEMILDKWERTVLFRRTIRIDAFLNFCCKLGDYVFKKLGVSDYQSTNSK